MSIWILSRTAPLLSDWCVPWNAFSSPKLMGVWASLAHSSWVQLFRIPWWCQEGTAAAQWCSQAGAGPCCWQLPQHCPFPHPPDCCSPEQSSDLAQVKPRQKSHQFQSKLHFTSVSGVTGRPHRHPDIGKLRDFSQRWQVQPGWTSSATPARYKLIFHEKRRLKTLRTSSVKITRFSSSGGCSASLKQTQELSDASPHFPGAIKAHAEC